MAKKGQESSTPALGFVLLVVVLVVSLSLLFIFRDNFFQKEDDTSCISQIKAHLATVALSKEKVSLKINCPTKRVDIETEEQEEARKVIADEMKRCWTMWQQGEKKLFGEKEGLYCHVCTMITIQGVSEVNGLQEYLNTHKATKTQTYSEYLIGKKGGDYFNEAVQAENAQLVIRTDKSLGVIFYYAKGQEWYNMLRNKVVGEPAVGTAAGVASGLFIAGAIVSATGVGIPVGIVIFTAGAAVGAAGGFFASLAAREDSDYFSFIAVRQLTEDDAGSFGCQYSAASNE